jgi:2-polyprenyl-3-methyl-5-hydroxy-6-metoxy-1,4-benzoquinol methylase
VLNPRTDYADLYDEAYYRGGGADPKVDYVAELDDPHTLRTLEWHALEQLAAELVPLSADTRWLDLGCGVGGFVRHLREKGYAHAVGHDEGYGADLAARNGLPIIGPSDLEQRAGSFDVVSSIEVIEHVVDPMSFLERAAKLLAPGGVFILTTGNVERAGDNLAEWYYVIPDVHVTFLGPTSLTHAYRRVGLRAETTGFRPSHVDLIRYKVLKTLGQKRSAAWHRGIPWGPLMRFVDHRYGVSSMPFGRKPADAR